MRKEEYVCKLKFIKTGLRDLMYLTKELKARTQADTLRESLRLMLFLYKKRKCGWKVLIEKGNKTKEILVGDLSKTKR